MGLVLSEFEITCALPVQSDRRCPHSTAPTIVDHQTVRMDVRCIKKAAKHSLNCSYQFFLDARARFLILCNHVFSALSSKFSEDVRITIVDAPPVTRIAWRSGIARIAAMANVSIVAQMAIHYHVFVKLTHIRPA